MVYLLIFANFFVVSVLFLLIYKKCKLPNICFFREAPAIAIIASIAGVIFKIYNGSFPASLLKFSVILFVSFAGVILVSFFRDPKREFKGDDNIVISPADGKILYIRKVEKGNIPVSIKGKSNIPLVEIAKTDLFNQDSIIIGIVMSIIDVHVNRAPVAGEIVFQKHEQGKFLSLKLPESDTQNERNVIVFKKGKNFIGVIQIASRVVRRILSFVKEGAAVTRGQKIGRILFGSQVDIILPAEAEVLVTEGLRVHAGLTPIAKIG